jgi:hypothetical protein
VQELRAADISDKPGDEPAPEDLAEEEIAL